MSHKKTVKKMDNKKSTKKTAVILTVCFVALALLCAFCVWLIIDTLDKKIEGELNSPTATPQENVYIEFGDEALEQEIKDRYGSVSYTHLDVYKRQLQNLPWFLQSTA